jgi:carboxyl-terminal processing protease
MNHPDPLRRSSLAPFVLLILGLFGGVLLDRSGLLPGSASREPPGLGRTFAPFWEAWHLVQEHYVDRKAIEPKRLTQGSIRGMLDALGDVGHTTYLTPEELKATEEFLKGELEGIGAILTVREHRPTIAQTLPGSPARKAGLLPGDALLQVNGKTVVDESPDHVAALIRGKAGTEVRLRVARSGQTQPLDLTIVRAKIEVPQVSWHHLPGTSLAHLAIREFGKHTDDQLRQAIKEIRAAGLKGLIVDVRANPGGLKEQAVAVTSEFLNGGVVFIEQDAQGRRQEVPVRKGGVATDLPLCVLIDGGTASSAEIFAGALQDQGRGKLIGTRTFGTGTVLEPFELSDGSAVLLAVAEWLTPKGRRIWHQGIKPDIEVALPPGASILLPDEESNLDAAGLARSKDAQLLKAIEVLTGKSPSANGQKAP